MARRGAEVMRRDAVGSDRCSWRWAIRYFEVRDRIAQDCGWECTHCGTPVYTIPPTKETLATVDHKISLSLGGSWKRYNLTCASQGCKNAKGDRTVEEFLLRQTNPEESATPGI